MKDSRALNYKIALILCYIILIFIMGIQANQCPEKRNSNIGKRIRYVPVNNASSRIIFYDANYDIKTGDFFYLGKFTYSGTKFFVSRARVNGTSVWSNVFTDTAVYNSLDYSPTYEIVYHTLSVSSKFTLIRTNSLNGTFLESYQIDSSVKQSDYINVCSLSADESYFFCLGLASTQAVIKFDASNLSFHVTYYPSSYISSRHLDIVTLNNDEVFFSMSQSTTYHLIKASFNISNSVFTEHFHQSFSTGSSSDSFKAVVDETGDTIWIGFGLNDDVIGYSQYNLTNFSLIGSKYALNYISSLAFQLNGIGTSNHMIAIMFFQRHIRYFAIVNATTQDMIVLKYMNSRYDYDSKGILVLGGYLSFFNYGYHTQMNLTLEQVHRYSGFYDCSYTFMQTSLYDLSAEALSNYTIIDESKTVYNVTNISSLTIQVSENDSYVLSMPDSSIQNFTVIRNRNLFVNISLPCSLVTYDTLSYSLRSEDSLTRWMKINYTKSEINVQAPNVKDTEIHPFKITTRYSHGRVRTDCNIIVELESSECDGLNSDSGIDYQPNGMTVVLQIATILAIILEIINAFIRRSSPQGVWTIVNIMQLILVMPLMVRYVNKEVKNFIISAAFSALSAYSLPVGRMKSLPPLKYFSFHQPYCYLERLGWQSGSSIVNNIVLIFVFIVVGMIHLLVFLFYKWTKNRNYEQCKLVEKIFYMFTLSIYIRIVMQTYIFTLLTSVFEVWYNYGGDEHSSGYIYNIYSHFLSKFTIFALVGFLILAYMSLRKIFYKKEIEKKYYLKEFYASIRTMARNQDENGETNLQVDDSLFCKVKAARTYSLWFLFRRLLIIILLAFVSFSTDKLIISLLIVLQTISIIYISLIRCFERMKDQICEVVNEITYLVLMILLAIFDSSTRSTSNANYMIIAIILSLSWFLCFGSIFTFTKTLIKYMRKRRENASQANLESDHENMNMSREAEQVSNESARNDQFNLNPRTAPYTLYIDRNDLHAIQVPSTEQAEDIQAQTMLNNFVYQYG